MPREIQRGYLSGVLQRGARTVRGLAPGRRAPLSDQSRASAPLSPVTPLEIETFSNLRGTESQVLEMKRPPSAKLQSNASNPSLPASDTTAAPEKLEAERKETGPQTRSIETNQSPSDPPRSVRNHSSIQPVTAQQSTRAAAKSSPQTPSAVPQGMVKASTVNRSAQVVEPTAGQNEARDPLGGAIESADEKRSEANSNRTDSSGPKGPPSFRIRDGYLRAREILRERTNDSTNSEASAVTRAAESNSSLEPQSGSSYQQRFDQFEASPQAGGGEQTARAEPLPANSQRVVAAPREALPKKDATSRESALAPRAEVLGEVFVQPVSAPRFAEASASQRVNPNSMSPEAPKLTIKRLDIQIIDQTPQPTIVVPMRPAARSDGGENIDRYQLGHIHLIF